MMVSVEKLKQDSRSADLVSKHTCNCWVSDQKCVMTYMFKGAEWLNMVFSHRDDVDTSTWTPKMYKKELIKQYGNWNSCVAALLEHARTNIQNWPIEQTTTLPRWTSESGRFTLAGDATHSMAFYLSMGVSMAIEDAVSLCECLRLHGDEDLALQAAMKLFESVRKERAQAVRDASLNAGNVLQISSGPLRYQRDEALRTDGSSVPVTGGQSFLQRNSYGIADEMIRDWCYGYDVVAAVNIAFDAQQSQTDRNP